MATRALSRQSWSLSTFQTLGFTNAFSSTLSPCRHQTASASRRILISRGQQPMRTLEARHFTSSSIAKAEITPSETQEVRDPSSLTSGFSDQPIILDEGTRQVDWSRSYHGLSTAAFDKEASDILLAPIDPEDVEIKPDGIIYLPEIKYRRILNKAFGPGGWGLAPRGETIVTARAVTREYALVVLGRLVSIARGEQDYFTPEGIPTAAEGCKSNALLRCCKDLGVASELWDPRFIRKYMAAHSKEMWVEHVVTKKKKKIYLRKEDSPSYPYREAKMSASGTF